MTSTTHHEGKKWINTAVAILAILVGYVILSFVQQLAEWFELESKISHFRFFAQGIAIAVGLTTFLVATRYKKSADYLREVYGELVKVVWPERALTAKHTVGVIIGVTIAGFVLGLFDFVANKLLGLLN